MELIRAYDPIKAYVYHFKRIDRFPTSLIVELKSDGVSGFGEATSNPYYNTSVPIMIEDLNKIRIIETSDGETPEDFWKKCIPI
jgi:L-alanine-DL-glutamate epimerase-like enolase superfamily enzyme